MKSVKKPVKPSTSGSVETSTTKSVETSTSESAEPTIKVLGRDYTIAELNKNEEARKLILIIMKSIRAKKFDSQLRDSLNTLGRDLDRARNIQTEALTKHTTMFVDNWELGSKTDSLCNVYYSVNKQRFLSAADAVHKLFKDYPLVEELLEAASKVYRETHDEAFSSKNILIHFLTKSDAECIFRNFLGMVNILVHKFTVVEFLKTLTENKLVDTDDRRLWLEKFVLEMEKVAKSEKARKLAALEKVSAELKKSKVSEDIDCSSDYECDVLDEL
jgi:hypothetical protein